MTGGAASSGGSKSTGGSKTMGGATSTSAVPTWTQLFTNYFASGTAGDCVSCHASNSVSFNSASTMCSALKKAGYIGAGTASLDTLLSWFGKGGNMPQNNNPKPANAVADITAWQNAGAVCP